MMDRIYSYCSYKQSPAGFQLGSAYITDQEKIRLSNDDLNGFVQSSFESGMIKEVYGKLPRTDRYIYIVKKLKYVAEKEDEFAAIIHMNLAFEYDEFKDYIYFMKGIDKYSSEEIAEKFHSIIIPDTKEADFALMLDGNQLSTLLRELKEEGKIACKELKQQRKDIIIKNSKINKNDEDITHFILKSKQTGPDKIKEIYGDLTDGFTSLSKNNEYEIILKKTRPVKNINPYQVRRAP